jgi:hypothetical protein
MPLLPFMLFYAVEAVRFLLARGNRAVQYGMAALGLAVAGVYLINLAQVKRSTFAGDVTDSQTTELFAYLRECEAGVRFVSERPRALALFTGHEATTAGTTQHEPDRFAVFTQRMNVDYVVTFRGSRMDSATVTLPGLSTTFENARFVVRAIPGSNGEHRCPAS